ncbi:MAG: hypothetical protein SGJ13_05825 [Actinomycetota bacterium]|nr:hypothetical protein [Actinomycetota bacterium]
MDELIPVTTYVPKSKLVAFQVKAAVWASQAEGTAPPDNELASSRYNDRWPADQRPDWSADESELAKFVHKKLHERSVSGRALSFMANHPDAPMLGRALAVELGLADDESDATGHQQIAGCWGHLGRYCEGWRHPIPFRFSEEDGYWVTAKTAQVLKSAGF